MSEDEKSNLEVILEDMNGKFDLVLEGHVTLEHMIHEHRAETRQDKRELQSLIQTSHDSLDEKIDGVRTELKEEIQGVRTELKEEIQGVRTELKEEIQGVRTELKEEIQGVRTELKEEIQGVDKRLTSEIRIVGQKACLCVDARRQVDGHEDRIRFLERKTA